MRLFQSLNLGQWVVASTGSKGHLSLNPSFLNLMRSALLIYWTEGTGPQPLHGLCPDFWVLLSGRGGSRSSGSTFLLGCWEPQWGRCWGA